MAKITNPEAVKFANEKIRVAANKLAEAYYLAKQVSQEWVANSMGDLIAYDNADSIVDGSKTDGRHPISGAAASLIINRLDELIADYEASGAAKLNTILAVTTRTPS